MSKHYILNSSIVTAFVIILTGCADGGSRSGDGAMPSIGATDQLSDASTAAPEQSKLNGLDYSGFFDAMINVNSQQAGSNLNLVSRFGLYSEIVNGNVYQQLLKSALKPLGALSSLPERFSISENAEYTNSQLLGTSTNIDFYHGKYAVQCPEGGEVRFLGSGQIVVASPTMEEATSHGNTDNLVGRWNWEDCNIGEGILNGQSEFDIFTLSEYENIEQTILIGSSVSTPVANMYNIVFNTFELRFSHSDGSVVELNIEDQSIFNIASIETSDGFYATHAAMDGRIQYASDVTGINAEIAWSTPHSVAYSNIPGQTMADMSAILLAGSRINSDFFTQEQTKLFYGTSGYMTTMASGFVAINEANEIQNKLELSVESSPFLANGDTLSNLVSVSNNHDIIGSFLTIDSFAKISFTGQGSDPTVTALITQNESVTTSTAILTRNGFNSLITTPISEF